MQCHAPVASREPSPHPTPQQHEASVPAERLRDPALGLGVPNQDGGPTLVTYCRETSLVEADEQDGDRDDTVSVAVKREGRRIRKTSLDCPKSRTGREGFLEEVRPS